jgi:two-component system, chemotaxis family, chemotaxis protein CheY
MAKRILTVDDSKTMRDMVSFTLRKAGFDVNEAEDGKQALSVLSGGRFDLIITDLNMPVMDGISLIKNVRASTPHRGVPILILTTESDSAKKADGKAAGATGWLVKPFSPEKLVELVMRVCP